MDQLTIGVTLFTVVLDVHMTNSWLLHQLTIGVALYTVVLDVHMTNSWLMYAALLPFRPSCLVTLWLLSSSFHLLLYV